MAIKKKIIKGVEVRQNYFEMMGEVSPAPLFRETKKGLVVVIRLKVKKEYFDPRNATPGDFESYALQATAFGTLAKYIRDKVKEGDFVHLLGHHQNSRYQDKWKKWVYAQNLIVDKMRHKSDEFIGFYVPSGRDLSLFVDKFDKDMDKLKEDEPTKPDPEFIDGQLPDLSW